MLIIGLWPARAFAATTGTADFPVDSLVYRSILASFLEQPRELQRYADLLTSYDLSLQARGATPTGCSDNARWLWAESLPTEELREAGYVRALAGPTDEVVSIGLEAALAGQIDEQIESTHRQDRWNRWADIFNSSMRNLGRLANGQLRGGVKFITDLIFSGRQFTKATDRDRKEYWLIGRILEENPDSQDAARLRKRKAALEERLRRDEIRRSMQAAKLYAHQGWWEEAYANVLVAENAGYTGKKKFRDEVRKAVADRRRWIEESLAVADTERYIQTREQALAYRALLAALVGGDREQLGDAGARAGKALSGTPLADEAEDAMSVLFEWSGDRRQALNVQRDLALRYPDTQTGMAARARLDDPQYNPRAQYDREMAEYKAEKRDFVLFGQRDLKQNVDLLSEFAAPSVPDLGVAGAFLVTDVAVRSVTSSFGGPVTPADVIAAGERLLADPGNLLTPEEESEIRVELGVLYEKIRRFDEAKRVYRDARVLSPELDTQLAERAADDQYRRIMELEDPERQVLLFERLISNYPDTKAARRAGENLDRFRKESKIEFVIPRHWLEEDPVHWTRLGARVPYELIDGSDYNRELNENGLVFWRDAPGSATFVCSNGRTKGYINLTPTTRAALRAAAETWADEKISLDAGELAIASRRLPFAMHGSLGRSGLLVYPSLVHAPLSEADRRRFD